LGGRERGKRNQTCFVRGISKATSPSKGGRRPQRLKTDEEKALERGLRGGGRLGASNKGDRRDNRVTNHALKRRGQNRRSLLVRNKTQKPWRKRLRVNLTTLKGEGQHGKSEGESRKDNFASWQKKQHRFPRIFSGRGEIFCNQGGGGAGGR